MLRGSPMKGPGTVSSSMASASEQSGLLDCPHCFIPLVRIKSKQKETRDQYFVKCLNSFKGDPDSCPFIKSEKEYQSWAARQRLKNQVVNSNPTAATPFCGEGYGDMSHELDLLKHLVDSVATEVSNMKKQQDHVMQQGEPGKKWLVVVDITKIAVLCVGVMIGVVVAKIWK